MTREYLKKATLISASGASVVHDTVVSILEDIKPGGDAKRILFGSLGIDMIADPTDSLILADKTADPHIVAPDLVSQAEHGYNSPVCLVTDDKALANDVMARLC